MSLVKDNKGIALWLLFFFILLAAALSLVIYFKESIAVFDTVYFIIVIILGLAGAVFFYKIIDSSNAEVSGTYNKISFKLSGATAVAGCVVLAGYYFKPAAVNATSFNLTVNLRSDGKMVNTGSVALILDGPPRIEKVSDKGSVTFDHVPEKFRNKKVEINYTGEGFEAAGMRVKIPQEGNSISMEIKTKLPQVVIHGTVLGKKRKPVKHAEIIFNDGLIKTFSDSAGNYTAAIPLNEGAEAIVRVYVEGEIKYDERVLLSSQTSIDFILQQP